MKQHLQNAAALVTAWVPDALMAAGGASIAYGAGLVYAPAGWIVGGALVVAAGVLLARGAR